MFKKIISFKSIIKTMTLISFNSHYVIHFNNKSVKILMQIPVYSNGRLFSAAIEGSSLISNRPIYCYRNNQKEPL